MKCKELNKNYNYSLVKVEMESNKFNNSPKYKIFILKPNIVTNKITLDNRNKIGVIKQLYSTSFQLLYNKVQSLIVDGSKAH